MTDQQQQPPPEGKLMSEPQLPSEQADRFQFILDVVPQWWRDLKGVQIECTSLMPIALIPGAEPAIAGDWIIRMPDGTILTKSSEEGRVRAREMLRKEFANAQ